MKTEKTWWRAVCGGKQATERLRSHGIDTIGKLYAYVRGPGGAAWVSPLFVGGNGGDGGGGGASLSKKARGRTKRLQRLVNDDDIALKMSSLLFRLMSAFEELRVREREELSSTNGATILLEIGCETLKAGIPVNLTYLHFAPNNKDR